MPLVGVHYFRVRAAGEMDGESIGAALLGPAHDRCHIPTRFAGADEGGIRIDGEALSYHRVRGAEEAEQGRFGIESALLVFALRLCFVPIIKHYFDRSSEWRSAYADRAVLIDILRKLAASLRHTNGLDMRGFLFVIEELEVDRGSIGAENLLEGLLGSSTIPSSAL